jgi:hypothetical protein
MFTNKLRGIIFLAAAVAPVSVFAGQFIGGWGISADASGGAVTMTLTNPKTYLSIESAVTVDVDYQGTPSRGSVKFADGIQRDLNYPTEVMFYWDEFKGPHALWEYYASVNRVDIFNPDDVVIPPSMNNRFTRVITKAGVEYFGNLAASSGNPDWFVVQIRGNNVTMYRHAIAMMQQLK